MLLSGPSELQEAVPAEEGCVPQAQGEDEEPVLEVPEAAVQAQQQQHQRAQQHQGAQRQQQEQGAPAGAGLAGRWGPEVG